jgi:hypothetical protein
VTAPARRPDHSVAGETGDGYRWIVLGVTSVGALLASLTSGTLVIALPEILRDLHTDLFGVVASLLGAVVSASRGDKQAIEDEAPARRAVAA